MALGLPMSRKKKKKCLHAQRGVKQKVGTLTALLRSRRCKAPLLLLTVLPIVLGLHCRWAMKRVEQKKEESVPLRPLWRGLRRSLALLGVVHASQLL